jgi:predicted ArsR family transcriptional regulator
MTQTSLEAYFNEVQPKLGRNQKLVLEALEDIFPATNKQIAKHLGWEINSITPRILELRAKGKVVKAYVAKDESGRSATFWKPKGSYDEYPETI